MRAAAVLALALAAGPACDIARGEYFGRIPDPDPAHFRWCNYGEPEFIDPALVTSTNGVKPSYALFDGLTTHDPDGLPLPSMAERWDVSEDMRTFTFHLRDGLRWSDGAPITSADYVYSAWRVLHPTTGSRNAESMWRIVNAEMYTAGRVKVMLRDAGGFRAGEVVVVDDPAAPSTEEHTLRRAVGPIPAGERVTVLELDAARTRAYVYHLPGEGFYGWVPLADLAQVNADREYAVTSTADTARKGRVRGRDILMLPEALGVRAPDPRTIVFETVGPTPYFVELTLQRMYRPSPRHAVEKHPRTWTQPEHIVTSGPFHLTTWVARDRLEMKRSDTFWDRARVRLEKVTIYSLDDQSASVNLYYQGSCDAVASNNIPASFYPVLAGETARGGKPKKDYERSPYAGVYFLMINVKRFPNLHLRRALSHALDRTALPRLIKGGQIPTSSYTPGKSIAELEPDELAACSVTRDQPGVAVLLPGGLCYLPPLGADFDPEAARRELARAKEELGAAFPRTITIKFNTGVEQHKLVSEWVQYEWKKHLGIDVVLESQEWRVFLADTEPGVGAFDVARLGWIGNMADPGAEFLPNYLCASPNNRPGWCSPEYDRLMSEAEMTADARARLELLRKAEAIMIADQPILPLFVYTQHALVKPYVRGLASNLFDMQSLREVWIDPDWKAGAAK